MKGRTGARPPLAGSAAIPTLTNAKSPYQTPEEEQEAREAAAAAQLTVWRQHLPHLLKNWPRSPIRDARGVFGIGSRDSCFMVSFSLFFNGPRAARPIATRRVPA